MSDTPRTDQRAFKAAFLPPEAIVTADFARELERELAQRTAELAKATSDRDEARREVCFAYGPMVEALAAAKRRGWDCFDAKEGSGA